MLFLWQRASFNPMIRTKLNPIWIEYGKFVVILPKKNLMICSKVSKDIQYMSIAGILIPTANVSPIGKS